jgi:hypothetical protein
MYFQSTGCCLSSLRLTCFGTSGLSLKIAWAFCSCIHIKLGISRIHSHFAFALGKTSNPTLEGSLLFLVVSFIMLGFSIWFLYLQNQQLTSKYLGLCLVVPLVRFQILNYDFLTGGFVATVTQCLKQALWHKCPAPGLKWAVKYHFVLGHRGKVENSSAECSDISIVPPPEWELLC